MAINPSPTDVEKNKEELQTIYKNQSDLVNHLQTSAFTLSNYYFVFQGVILGGIAKVRCSDRWFFFSLSLIAAVLNLLSLIVIGRKYKRSLKHIRRTVGERDHLQSVQAKQNNSHDSERRSVNTPRPQVSEPAQHQGAASQGSGSQEQVSGIEQIPSQPTQHQEAVSRDSGSQEQPSFAFDDKYEKFLHDIYFNICIGLFVIFAIIVLVSCLTIPCRKAHHGEKCIRLCEGNRCISICTQN